MKILLLCGSALLTSLGAANAQGWNAKGVYDDFKDTSIYENGPNNEGAYWWENTNKTALKVSRTGGAITVTATAAGGCTTGANCYPLFGVNFGTVNSIPVTIDISKLADITIDIENMVNKPTYVAIVLQDANGKQAKFEPNVSDVVPGTPWDSASKRKALVGFSFGDYTDPGVNAKVRKTVKLDLSSVPGKIGGLTGGTYQCDPAVTYNGTGGSYKGGPSTCPLTSYDIDPSKITNILFMVNFGKDDIFISEGTTDPTKDYKQDTYISGTNIASYTGALKIHSFAIGTVPGSVVVETKENNALKVFPNPAKDVLNVSFNASSGTTLTLTDIFGRTVYTSSVSAGANNILVNTSDFSTGMYILNLVSENGSVSSKVTIQ